MRSTLLRAVTVLMPVALVLWSASAPAAVIVFTNRTRDAVEFRLRASHGQFASPDLSLKAPPRPYRDYKIESGDTISLPVLGAVEIEFPTPTGNKKYHLEANTVCYFGSFESGLDLQQISFDDEGTADGPIPVGLLRSAMAATDEEANRAAALAPTAVIPVKVLVDDNEAARTELWQQRLRDRLAKASQILERACRVRFEIVEFGKWDTDEKVTDFEESLTEFEREVDPTPARLAIGFASQFDQPAGPTKLGGVRGPFRPHCLIREWPKVVSEPERLEVLLHELCHVLGAAHSPEPDTVLRPMLGDGQARARAFQIKIDPVNTLLMYLTCEDVRQRNAFSLGELSPRVRLQLLKVYTGIDRALPTDPAARQIHGYVASSVKSVAQREQAAFAAATRQVLAAIVAAARADETGSVSATLADEPAPAEDGQDAVAAPAEPNGDDPEGDKRTERIVRAAARSAGSLEARLRGPALFVALAMASDPRAAVADHPQLKALVEAAENAAERDERIHVVGAMTMRGRGELARQFFLSAAMASVFDASQAEQMALDQELADMQGKAGFSFIDYTMSLAGIEFVRHFGHGKAAAQRIEARFSVSAVMPALFGLETGVTAEAFGRDYVAVSDPHFHAVRDRILARIATLPAYAEPAAPATEPAAQTSP